MGPGRALTPPRLRRRTLLHGGGAALLGAALAGCERAAPPLPSVRWVGDSAERGHLLRAEVGLPAPGEVRRGDVLVVGAGIAGLVAARALRAAGREVDVVELEEQPGGNSRGHAMGGMRCPLGAHYLPLPGPQAEEVRELLRALGLLREASGRLVADERHLCHAPQERLWIGGRWVEGLLPPVEALPAAEQPRTHDDYRRFAAAVRAVAAAAPFAVPTARAGWNATLAALDAMPFDDWLASHGFTSPALRWLLDYSCRDDYGAGSAQVSAWAGLHYFASRHGFDAPGEAEGGRDELLTWPEGNAWLVERLAAPLAPRCGVLVRRVAEGRHGVEVDWAEHAGARAVRWQGRAVVLAVPLFVAARLLESAPDALRQAVAQSRRAPWLVANLQLREPLDEQPGAPPAWDNVRYGSEALGYVDAMHQSTRPHAGPTVLSAYWALGGSRSDDAAAQRRALLERHPQDWAAQVLRELAVMHPELPSQVEAIDLARHGHAMALPVPGARGSLALAALARPQRRVHFAHADLSAYSVFEEAAYHGARAARQLLRGP